MTSGCLLRAEVVSNLLDQFSDVPIKRITQPTGRGGILSYSQPHSSLALNYSNIDISWHCVMDLRRGFATIFTQEDLLLRWAHHQV